jgi:hypothetical protein
MVGLVFPSSMWLYLRINYVQPNDLETTSKESEMAKYKRKIILYVLVGLLLGVPAIYFIIEGVTQDLFTTLFPIAYIILMSVVSIAFLPGFLKATGAIAPVRYFILTVMLFVILLKVAVYLTSYFPGTLTDVVGRHLFFALGCGNVFLLFLLNSAWHQVFTLERVVVLPLNHVTPPKPPTPENDEVIIVTVPPPPPANLAAANLAAA